MARAQAPNGGDPPLSGLFDTHAHLLDEAFDPDRDELIASLPGAGIWAVLEACCDEAEIARVIALVEKYPFVYGSAGVHPHSASAAGADALCRVQAALSHEKILAVGEIGLDYHYDFSPRDVQKKLFAEQLAIAKAQGKPVLIHDREAHGDMLDILRAERDGLRGVMHCFSGSYEIARACIDYGLHIAFGGALTFANAVKQREIAARLPIDRLLIETDCPYMTPVPYRGKRNDPRLMQFTCRKLAEVRGMDADEVARATRENAVALLGIAATHARNR